MSGGRGEVEHPSGSPGDSAVQPPPSRSEPGPGRPVRSNGPERPSSVPRPRPPVPEPEGPALRVVLVSRDIMLAAALRSLIEQPGGVRVLDWYSEELDAAIRHADVVVVDLPPSLYERAFAVIDGRFLGRTVVLLQEGEHPEALPSGTTCAVLYRPLQIAELWAAITGVAPEEAEPVGPGEPEPGQDAAAGDPEPVAEAPPGQGLPVAESGLLIGLSGRELEPVVGPGQVAPGMDRVTFDQLRRWGRQPTGAPEGRSTGRGEAPSAKAARAEQRRAERAAAARAKAAGAEARREQARQEKAAARAEADRVRAARAEARTAAREESRQQKAAKAEARTAAREQARQAKAAKAEARAAAREEARQAKAAEAEARAAEREVARRVRAAEAAARKAEREEAEAAKAAARAAAREEARQAKAAEAEARAAAREEARRVKAAEEAARAAAREEARRVKAAEAADRRAVRAEARQAKAAEAKARRAERAAARKVRREETRQARAAKAETRRAARQEAAQARAASAEVRRGEAQQAKAAQAEAREVARAEAAQQRAARAQARQAARAEAARERAAQGEARKVAREEAQVAKAAQAEARRVGREEARQETRQARAARAEVRRARRVEAAQRRVAQLEARRAARSEARQARGAGAEDRGAVGGLVRTALVVVLLALVGLAAAGWRAGGGPDTQAGEVAVARAAGGNEGGLVAQDPRVGPIEPLHALGVGAWLRATEAGASLEGAIREARVPSRFLLAGVVGLTALLFLLLMRVGPGTGAAAGPGPAPPHGWRLGGAALAGALVALDPVLVRSGRTATGTVLAVGLALGALLLAWGLPARPALRWLPLVAAGAGLALLVSPLALGVLAVPVVAELLQGRHREAWRAMAALGLGIGLWLVLPVWVAGQDLAAGQAGWLLGRPPGRGSLGASLGDAPLSWLLVATGLAAAFLTWRHRSGARPDTGKGAARVLAWTATSAAGAVAAVALGYPTSQALPFAVPAAAVSLALAGVVALTAAAGRPQIRLTGGVRGTAGVVPRWMGAGTAVVLAGLLVAQGVAWGAGYGRPADDGLARLVATVGEQVPDCSAVNASGPADRARLLAAGATVTEFSDGPAAHAAGVRFFVLTGATAEGGPMTPSLATWVRQYGRQLAAHPSRSLSGVELWRVDANPLDPVADSIPVPGGVFSNVTGSACGGYRVVDSQVGAFHTGYQAAGGKAVLGRPLGSVWTSDGPALQAFDTMVLGAVPTASGPPAVRPIELPPLLAKLDIEAVAEADIPLPSVRPPVSNQQTRALLSDEVIARAYLGTDPATATASDFRRARDRFGRPLGTPQMMPDGAVRQPFERAVLELPAGGGPARPAALGRLAVRLGLVPRQAMRPEPVPGLPVPPPERRLDTVPLLRLTGAGLALLALAAVAGALSARRSRSATSE